MRDLPGWLGPGGGSGVLAGQDGNDRLRGKAGRDLLSGSGGADRLTGGGDADAFSIGWSQGADTITDAQAGLDEIRPFSRFDEEGGRPGALDPGPLDPALFPEGAARGAGGQSVVLDLGASDRLAWDANGTGAAGETVVCTFLGEPRLAASDVEIL